MGRRLADIEREMEGLPVERQAEVLDFIEFLKRRQASKREVGLDSEVSAHTKRIEIETLAGALADDPIVRPPQGIFEVRESLV